MEQRKNQDVRPYMNPYLAGFLLGVLLLLALFISGRGLGASGAVRSGLIAFLDLFLSDPGKASPFFHVDTSPLRSWLVFEVSGLILGAFLSGFLSGRMKLTIDKGPGINNITRLSMAAAGGILFGVGSQLARGCTSGAALSGMAVFSSAGFLTMMAIFGTGYVIAYFFRKLWI